MIVQTSVFYQWHQGHVSNLEHQCHVPNLIQSSSQPIIAQTWEQIAFSAENFNQSSIRGKRKAENQTTQLNSHEPATKKRRGENLHAVLDFIDGELLCSAKKKHETKKGKFEGKIQAVAVLKNIEKESFKSAKQSQIRKIIRAENKIRFLEQKIKELNEGLSYFNTLAYLDVKLHIFRKQKEDELISLHPPKKKFVKIIKIERKISRLEERINGLKEELEKELNHITFLVNKMQIWKKLKEIQLNSFQQKRMHYKKTKRLIEDKVGKLEEKIRGLN